MSSAWARPAPCTSSRRPPPEVVADPLLAGVRVVDLAGEPAAMTGRILADLGATVTRAEPSSGDPLRQVGPFGPDGRSLRHLVQIAQPTCSAPGCRRDAERCDLDHAIPYDKGGRTCACNAGARSRKCHRIKQSAGWTVAPATWRRGASAGKISSWISRAIWERSSSRTDCSRAVNAWRVRTISSFLLATISRSATL